MDAAAVSEVESVRPAAFVLITALYVFLFIHESLESYRTVVTKMI